MAFHVDTEDIQAWLEPTKLQVSSLDQQLEGQIAASVLARLAAAYPADVASWTSTSNTPVIVKKIIAMQYAGWFYSKMYSQSDGTNAYALLLLTKSEELLEGIASGTNDIIEVVGVSTTGQPVFFPTDASSASVPTSSNPSDGGPRFTIAQVF